MNKFLNRTKRIATENKLLLTVFLLSTIFFLWQHQFVSWDFASYVSNAQYWNGGSYYEISRPPLVPFILYALGTSLLSEYIFIILASALFLYSTVRAADRMKIRRDIFYLFSLSPMVLFYGLLNGTELLSLALFELFFIYLTDKPGKNSLKAPVLSGLFLGLAVLTRYGFLIFLPLILSSRHPKKILTTLAVFAAMLVPWLAFNFLTTGNMLTSIADSFALNFKYRYYFTQPVSLSHILTAISFLLPLFVLGTWQTFRSANRKTGVMDFLCKEKANILLIVIFLLSLYQYVATPSKELRYLFPLALPAAYFAVKCLEIFKKKARIVAIIIILNLALFASMNSYETKDKYYDAIDTLGSNQLDTCRVLSNAWTIMNYLGQPSEPFPRKELVGKSINEGNIVIFFSQIGEPEWANRTFVREFPAIYESDSMVILGTDACNPQRRYEHNYLTLLHDKIETVHNVSINTNPCFAMFSKHEIAEKACNFINGKGFTTDRNREDGLMLVRD